MLLKLEPNQAHLWYLLSEWRTYRRVLLAADRLISADENDRSKKFITRQSQDAYLVARTFLRIVLSQYIDTSAEPITFRVNAYGKPHIATPNAGQALRFNVAHAGNLVVCGVALGREIGIDAEVIDCSVDTNHVADRYFSSAEMTALRALPKEEQRRRFFELWAVKESYIKARGLGLSLPLEGFTIVASKSGAIEIVFSAELDDDPDNWWLSLLPQRGNHVIAVALGRLPAERRISWRSKMELVVKPFDQCVARKSHCFATLEA